MIVRKFLKEDIEDVFRVQQVSYKPLFERYQDTEPTLIWKVRKWF